MTDFEEALRESNIPFLMESRDQARLPESFHREIEREYVVLAEKDDLMACEQWRSCTWGELATLEYGKALRDYRSAEGP